MASIHKLRNRWRVQVRKKGIHQSATFATKPMATAWAKQKEAEIELGTLTKSLGGEKTVEDALLEYGKRVSIGKDGNLWEQRRLKWFARSWLAALKLDEVNASHVARFRDERLQEVSGSTVNRDFNLLSHVFTKCVREWLWMNANPCSGLARPKENPARERRVSAAEIEKIRYVLDYETDKMPRTTAELTANLWLTSLETAMRLGEVNSIDQSNFFPAASHVHLKKTKNGDQRKAVCNKRAIELIKLRLQSEYHNTSHNISKCFENAVKRAAIADMTYHDSRHEAITRLAQKMEVLDLARTVGVRDLKTLLVYYNATPQEIAAKLD